MGLRRIDGPLIRKRREFLGLSLDDVEKESDGQIGKMSASNYERNINKPGEHAILILCRVLKCAYEDISVEVEDVSAPAVAA